MESGASSSAYVANNSSARWAVYGSYLDGTEEGFGTCGVDIE
jgi:hypothetical protein